MQVVPVPRFPVGKPTLPPRRHTGAGGLASYAPLPPLCTRCCDGLLLLATKRDSEEFNQRSSLIWTTARRLKEFLFWNFDVLLIDASSLAEKATFGAPQRVLSPPHAASVVVHVGCIADLVHPCPLACPSLVHRPSTDNATAVPRQANSSRPGVNGSQCSSITACSCRCLLFKHLTRSALVP